MQLTFDLFDDVIHTNAPEPAGVFGNPLKDFLTMEGNYTFHVVATYGDTCTATRELLWSTHVDPSVDSSRTDVTVNISGGKGTITVVPRDQYGNNVGPVQGISRSRAYLAQRSPGQSATMATALIAYRRPWIHLWVMEQALFVASLPPSVVIVSKPVHREGSLLEVKLWFQLVCIWRALPDPLDFQIREASAQRAD
jgi:hypothetical protein